MIAALFLLGFRVGLNVADSGVIDVGYAGVIGADRIADGDQLYGSELPGRRSLRRHLRAGQLLRLRPVRAGASRGAAAGTTCRPPTPRRSSSTSRRSRCLFLLGRRLRPGPEATGWGPSSASPGPPTPTPLSRWSRTPTTPWWHCCSSRRCSSSLARPHEAPLLALAGLTKFAPLAPCRRCWRPTGATGGLRDRSPRYVASPSPFAFAFVGASRSWRRPLINPGLGPSGTARSRARSTATRRSASGVRSPARTGCRSRSRSRSVALAVAGRLSSPAAKSPAQLAALARGGADRACS